MMEDVILQMKKTSHKKDRFFPNDGTKSILSPPLS